MSRCLLETQKGTHLWRNTVAEVSFGEWLRRRRKAEGWTQEQLALQISCSTSALKKIESEERRPSAQIVERLAEIFNIPPNEHTKFLRFARGDWQAISGGDIEDTPWHVSHGAPRSNLPASTTSFIGRGKEQEEIKNLIAKNRLVTLVGAGGIGKTRLSIQTASALLNHFPNGTSLVELAPLSDAVLVPQAIVNALGLIEQADRPPLTVLTGFLQDKHFLLILDNCEHLIQACAQLAEALLQACPDLHLLATSREALSIAGEIVYLVPSLTTPDPLKSTLDTLSQYEAVQLFLERAEAAMPNFSMTEDNAHAITQVCQHLDGIPLALELAAARVKVLSVEEIAVRLDDRFHLLTGGARTALPRHQTLKAMIDWSHDLLTEPERALLRRLSVFAGGWTLEAAESVGGDASIEKREILDLLTQLVNKSLILSELKQGQKTRYRMLETIREYSREKLWAAGEGETMRQRHLAYFVDLAEQAEPNLRAFDMVMWLDQLDAELGNIRVALGWAVESDVEAQLRLACALLWFWHIRGYRYEGIDWLEQGLSVEAMERGDRAMVPSHAMIRGRALNASGELMSESAIEKAAERFEESLELFRELGSAGKQGMAYALFGSAGWPRKPSTHVTNQAMLEQCLTWFREVGDKFGAAQCLMMLATYARLKGDFERAMGIAKEGLALREEIGDKDGIAIVRAQLGYIALRLGDYQQVRELYEESLAGFREVGNKWGFALVLSWLSGAAWEQGNHEQATRILEEALAIGRGLGDKSFIAGRLDDLGKVAWAQGDFELASKRFEEELRISQKAGDKFGTAFALQGLGRVAQSREDFAAARSFYSEALVLSREMSRPSMVPRHFTAFATLAIAQKQPEKATRLFGAAETFVASIRLEISPAERAHYDQAIAAARAALGKEGFNAAWAEGRGMTMEQAIAYALEE